MVLSIMGVPSGGATVKTEPECLFRGLPRNRSASRLQKGAGAAREARSYFQEEAERILPDG